MAGGGIYIPIISEYNDKGSKEAIKSLKSLAKTQLAGAVSAGALLELTRSSIKAAMQDAAAQKQLSLALANSTGASVTQQTQIEKNIAAMQHQYSVADDELRPALSTLARITGDLTKSQELLQIGLDVSASTGRDLQSVSESLGRAYQGNVGALRRLGLRVSDTAIATKDFGLAMDEVKGQVDGAGEAFAKTSEGKLKDLSIRFDDLKENLGNNLLSVILPVTDALASLSEEAGNTDKKTGLWSTSVGILKDSLKQAFPVLEGLTWLVSDNGNAIETVSGDYLGLASLMQRVSLKMDDLTVKNDKQSAAQKKAAAAAEAHKKKLAELAKTAREKAAAELERLTSVYDELIAKADDYRMSVSDQITGFISLADAVQTAEQSDSAYNDALVERKNAYEELTAIQEERKRRGFDIGDPNITYDANDYADALDRVAKAEQGVTDAQSKRVDYTAAFRTQITAAKEFASNLQALAAGDPPLGSMGIAQLLNLGPVAGNQVAKDLLSGLAGLTVSDINSTLASLSTASNLAGLQAASNDFGTQIQTAGRNIQATGNVPAPNIYVTVQQTDPRAVVDALRDWNWTNGGIPISIGTLF